MKLSTSQERPSLRFLIEIFRSITGDLISSNAQGVVQFLVADSLPDYLSDSLTRKHKASQYLTENRHILLDSRNPCPSEQLQNGHQGQIVCRLIRIDSVEIWEPFLVG